MFTCCLHAGHWQRPVCRCCSGCPVFLHGVVSGNTEPIWTAASGKGAHHLGDKSNCLVKIDLNCSKWREQTHAH